MFDRRQLWVKKCFTGWRAFLRLQTGAGEERKRCVQNAANGTQPIIYFHHLLKVHLGTNRKPSSTITFALVFRADRSTMFSSLFSTSLLLLLVLSTHGTELVRFCHFILSPKVSLLSLRNAVSAARKCSSVAPERSLYGTSHTQYWMMSGFSHIHFLVKFTCDSSHSQTRNGGSTLQAHLDKNIAHCGSVVVCCPEVLHPTTCAV